MATAIKAIPTLKGKDALNFKLRAEEAERRFKGIDKIYSDPKFAKTQSILHKTGML